MTTWDPALHSLLAFLNIAPIGIYFLVIGLINSHSRPLRLSSRTDFVALTSVLAPFVIWPIPALAAARQWTLLLAGLVLAAIAFWRLLPRPHAGWVIYNISEGRWRSALEAAARAAGIVGKWHGRTWQDAAGELSFSYTTFSQLRNVSVQIQADGGNVASHAERIGARLDAQFERMEQLPSASGALLLIVGILVTLFPVWLLGRHAHDVAQAVARLFG
ncbi:MAG: hypothetical protein HUU22_00920 [Phycisphaerae bacterium]|nr:hypothetical protein [Phycisphaerae bacterium]NUQ44577.1 hypothetical protein [Phycisphaerae bacterium]